MIAVTTTHKEKLSLIGKQLSVIGSKESSFTRIELLFYEAISIAREYGDSILDNSLLAGLKQVQANQYKGTTEYFKKSSQRENAIKKFITGLRAVLNKEVASK